MPDNSEEITTYVLYEHPEEYYPGRYSNSLPEYGTFSGTDITAQILLPAEFEEKPLHLGELQTLSYSIHRENKPVRCLGSSNPKGFVRGPRTIAGSMIFTVFDGYAFYRLNQYKKLVYSQGGENEYPIYPLADMLPPFDVLINFANENGQMARMKLYGVTIVDEGGTMSIEDLVTEQTYTYVARGIQPISSYRPNLNDYGETANPSATEFKPRITFLGPDYGRA